MVEVTLYTRRDCPLCDKAKAAMAGAGVEYTLREVDIDGDPALQARYKNDVPVIHIGGVEAFRHRVDPAKFAAVIREGVPQLGDEWRIVDDHHLEREYRFPDFAQALAFTNRIGAIAEEMNHHPDIHLSWGKVRVTTWTHTANGLTRLDYLLAAKIDRR